MSEATKKANRCLNHPDRKPWQIFLGMLTADEYRNCRWVTKQFGMSEGDKWPAFADKAEIKLHLKDKDGKSRFDQDYEEAVLSEE